MTDDHPLETDPRWQALAQRVRLDQELRRAPLAEARLIWVLGADLPPARWRSVLQRVRAGAGLVWVAGDRLPDLSALGVASLGSADDRITLEATSRGGGALTEQVIWPSSATGSAAASSARPSTPSTSATDLPRSRSLTGHMAARSVCSVTPSRSR